MEKDDKDFWHEHSRELIGASALGLAGLAVALANRRHHRHLQQQEDSTEEQINEKAEPEE